MPRIFTTSFVFSIVQCIQIAIFCWSVLMDVDSIKSTYDYIANIVIPIFSLFERNNVTITSLCEKFYELIKLIVLCYGLRKKNTSSNADIHEQTRLRNDVPKIEEDRNRQKVNTNNAEKGTTQKGLDDRVLEGEYVH